ncbi:PREDICTED: protein NUCLEAR FUSION DEFECTIVE 6, chloroplastic/mitochondrial isoform X1 [Prunus mume]|uniref:Protein NUCLEAR FUSION DEFECTIVE 6, chloroplastic/mitochondrial isoform X1 n=1 Tax=Prunus mume TaxID=102107 RepID=A0ABM1LM97_PRUMU|nr:PREDICTED: protein NUCLEAR FUSION DEFECTIVE 6, chloroplastic/mitochondrial isoform X1 [Prunus mume]
MASFAARSVLRSTAARATVGSRLASAARPKPASSPFRIPKLNQSSTSPRIFRSPVELSCCVETMLPYHTATASALLTSMLSVSQRSYGWTPEGVVKSGQLYMQRKYSNLPTFQMA